MLPQESQFPAGEPQSLEGKSLESRPETSLVQHPDHDVFAMHARHDGNPEIHGPGAAAGISGQRRPESPVLRHPALGDIQFGHHFEPGDDGLVVGPVHRLHRRIENAVHPVLQDHLPGLGLDVDVGGAPFDGVHEERIHQADDRASALGFLECFERNDRWAGAAVASAEAFDT